MNRIRNEFYGDSVDIRHVINWDLGVIEVYTNGDLRYTVFSFVYKKEYEGYWWNATGYRNIYRAK